MEKKRYKQTLWVAVSFMASIMAMVSRVLHMSRLITLYYLNIYIKYQINWH